MKLSGLYLAAGTGSRFGRRKQEEPWTAGGRLGGAALKALCALGLDRVAVVVRPDDPLLWLPEPEGEAPAGAASPLHILHCGTAGKGLSESVKCGLRELLADRPDGVLVVLADQPLVTEGWLRELIKLYEGSGAVDYAASADGDILKPPMILSAALCLDALEQLHGDRGAGGLVASGRYRGCRLALPQEDSGILIDVDTERDFEQARRVWETRNGRI